MDKLILKKIETEVKEKFDVRLVSDKHINGRDYIYFHIMDLCNTDKLDELTEYLKVNGKELGAIWTGWFDGHYEFIYE